MRENKFVYFNDTQKDIRIHPATRIHGCQCDMSPIKPYEEREFILPEGTYPWLKQWDNGRILVSPKSDEPEGITLPSLSEQELEEMAKDIYHFLERRDRLSSEKEDK